MSVASLELCKELHELSGWETPYFFTEDIEGRDAAYQHIRYDLGYLLCKLHDVTQPQRNITVTSLFDNHPEANPDKYWLAYVFGAPEAKSYANTPEDAVCKLAIGLFKSGILQKKGE